MKFLQYVTILACFIAVPAHANHFVDPADPRADNLYDAFNDAFIDPKRWRGQEFGSPLSATEAVREISRGRLRLFHRIHGEVDNDTGVRVGGARHTGVLTDGAPAGRASKFFDITNVAPNCMAGDRPEALMEVYFGNIRVN